MISLSVAPVSGLWMHNNAVTDHVGNKTLCRRCAELSEPMAKPEKMAEKQRATKPAA